ncbi:Clp protease [Mycolicibacterium parafortuitum]|uniref:Clp protease N-terminal domain-containing protein n=1 Tax=Mycolicibacterium parafortuitum TaxID=39692 RepID=UPI0032C49456
MFERFSRNARAAVLLAQQNARELGDERIGPEHLLFAVVQSAGRDLSATLAGYGVTVEEIRHRIADGRGDPFDEDADALRPLGIDLSAVRRNVDRDFGQGAFDDALRPGGSGRRRRHIPFATASKKTLELALREAVRHKNNWIGCEHILLGLLRGGDTVAAALLAEYVDPAELRRRVDTLLDAAA